MTTMQRFEYLLNAMEEAAKHEMPANHGYGEKRQAVLDFVKASLPSTPTETALRCESVLNEDGSTFRCGKAVGHGSYHEQGDWMWWDKPSIPSSEETKEKES